MLIGPESVHLLRKIRKLGVPEIGKLPSSPRPVPVALVNLDRCFQAATLPNRLWEPRPERSISAYIDSREAPIQPCVQFTMMAGTHHASSESRWRQRISATS